VHTSGPYQGFTEIPTITLSGGQAPAWDGLRTHLRRDADACSPGEVMDISGPVAGGARKGVGRRRPDAQQYDSGHSWDQPEAGTACEALGQKRPWSAWVTLGLGVSPECTYWTSTSGDCHGALREIKRPWPRPTHPMDNPWSLPAPPLVTLIGC
jgi:hypothetical protein